MASFLLPRPQLISLSGGAAACFPHRSAVGSFRKAKAAPLKCFSHKVSPWLMLPPSLDGNDLVYDFYSLGEDKIVSFNKRAGIESEVPDDEAAIVGMCNGWLIFYNCNHLNKGDGNMFLSNPLSRRHVKLPHVFTFNLPLSSCSNPMHVENVVISSHDPDDQNCRAVMIYGPECRLAFCCPAAAASWMPLGNKRGYCSSVYSAEQNLFFCITKEEGMQAWDLKNLHSPIKLPISDIDKTIFDFPFLCTSERERKTKFFFEPSTFLALDKFDDLYQVRRFTAFRIDSEGSHVMAMNFGELPCKEVFSYKTTDIDVYKYDDTRHYWNYMYGSLNGMVFFLGGKNQGFALSALDYPRLKPDAIYFTDIKPNPFYKIIGGGHDIGIFNYLNKNISPCYYPCDYRSIKNIFPPPLWFTPNW